VTPLDTRLAALRAARRQLEPAEAAAAAERGALLVDIRYGALRDRDGTLPGAVIVERNELEWRLDPAGAHRIPQAGPYGRPVVVVCNEGYASTLAAESLRALGLTDVTDLAGGFQAWRAAGLPVVPPDGTPTRPTATIAG
jgi:rhodanese-related sulfurtransferase